VELRRISLWCYQDGIAVVRGAPLDCGQQNHGVPPASEKYSFKQKIRSMSSTELAHAALKIRHFAELWMNSSRKARRNSHHSGIALHFLSHKEKTRADRAYACKPVTNNVSRKRVSKKSGHIQRECYHGKLIPFMIPRGVNSPSAE
jgi:hypothetical protein